MIRGALLARSQPSPPTLVTIERRKMSRVGQLAYRISGTADLSNTAAAWDAANVDLCVVQINQQAYAAAVKAINPNVKMGCYLDFSMTKSGTFSDGSASVGVPAASMDPTWYLYNGTTQLYLTAYNYLFACDVGNPAYITAWDAIGGALAQSRGFDFIHMDDVNPHLHTQLTSDLYPTDAAYHAAVQAGLRMLIPKLKARGLGALPNIGAWSDESYFGPSDAIAAFALTGLLEQWASFNNGPPTIQARVTLNDQLGRGQKIQKANGALRAICHVDSGSNQVAKIAWAMAWLVIEGAGKMLVGFEDATYAATPPSFSYTSYAPGLPIEDMQQISTYVWRRTCTNGQIWLNTDTASSAVVTFGGTYTDTDAGITSQTGATIPPQTALLLTPG